MIQLKCSGRLHISSTTEWLEFIVPLENKIDEVVNALKK